MQGKSQEKKSEIEVIIEGAEEGVLPGTSGETFLEAVSEIMDHHLDNMLLKFDIQNN